ncbi:hypothetical protein [uncultured Chryseobacterium sp.]
MILLYLRRPSYGGEAAYEACFIRIKVLIPFFAPLKYAFEE